MESIGQLIRVDVHALLGWEIESEEGKKLK